MVKNNGIPKEKGDSSHTASAVSRTIHEEGRSSMGKEEVRQASTVQQHERGTASGRAGGNEWRSVLRAYRGTSVHGELDAGSVRPGDDVRSSGERQPALSVLSYQDQFRLTQQQFVGVVFSGQRHHRADVRGASFSSVPRNARPQR